MYSRLIRNVLLIISGPIVTCFFYIASERISEWNDAAPLVKMIVIMGVCTLLFAALSHYIIKDFKKGMVLSIVVAELGYISYAVISSITDPVNIEENVMWLGVLIFFLIQFTLPMAILIAYGTGRIIEDLRSLDYS